MFDFPNSPAVNQAVTGPNGTVYVWDGAKWLASAGANAPVMANNVGRNLVTNGTFVVQQRGAGPWTTTNLYTADRWLTYITGSDTNSFSVVGLADADRTQISDETARYALQDVFTGSAAAGGRSQVSQPIEGVRRLSGKTITVSLWAKAISGTPRIGVSIYQSFGTGGSPSAGVVGPSFTTVALTASWVRYTGTIAVPSATGKTLGTNGDDNTNLTLVFSDQANALGTGVGVQSGTIQLWGVQLEIGTQATALDPGGSPQAILAECQRFYQTGNVFSRGYNTAAAAIQSNYTFAVQMRAQPTVTLTFVAGNNVTGTPLASYITSNAFSAVTTVSASGDAYVTNSFTASADL